MTGALRFSPARRALADAKASARRAYDRARSAGGLAPVLVDRLWADTLVAVDGQPGETAVQMYRRTEHLFVLVADRATWPR
jgi:hypothetical protein